MRLEKSILWQELTLFFRRSNLVLFILPVLQGSLAEWYRVFQLAGLVYIVGAATYLVWGQAELQPWARLEGGEREEGGEGAVKLIKGPPGLPSFKSADC
jgi:hypothetical protein